MTETRTLLRMGENLVVVKTETPDAESNPRLYVASSAADQYGATLNLAQVRGLADALIEWLAEQGKTTQAAEKDAALAVLREDAAVLWVVLRDMVDETCESHTKASPTCSTCRAIATLHARNYGNFNE